MGPKKRELTAESNSAKKGKSSSKTSQDLQEFPNTARTSVIRVELYLFLLPNEILLNIYNYLSAMDLASLTRLCDKRITELTFTRREANFSSCHKHPLLVRAFFHRNRLRFIQKLNLNYYAHPNICEISELICQCTQLTSLSAVECGLTYSEISRIVISCKKLEELAWTVRDYQQVYTLNRPNLKRMYLFCNPEEVEIFTLDYILRIFIKVENVWLYFTSDPISAFPFIGPWIKSSGAKGENIYRQYTVVKNSFYCSMDENQFQFLSQSRSEHVKNRRYDYIPCLQIKSSKKHLSSLSLRDCKVYTTVTIILTSEFVHTYKRLIRYLKEIAGEKLKHLSLQNEYDDPQRMRDRNVILVCDFLEKMFLTSKYVTVLNLTTIHFRMGSPFKAILQLKYLKIVDLPSCAFRHTSNLSDKNEGVTFSTLVSSCPEVETFTLNCCVDTAKSVSEDKIVPIKDWKHLKHLFVYNITFRTCNFLKEVADSCIQLQSVSLISVASEIKCLFTDDVIYLLKKAKNLSLLRINEKTFNPMFEGFWNAIGKAVNLEGICIITHSDCAVDEEIVIKALRNVKHLHLFHFYAPKASHLVHRVRGLLYGREIFDFKLKDDCNINRVDEEIQAPYYHKQPYFCCQYRHLNDINLF